MAVLKTISSVKMHVVKRLMVNYDTTRRYLRFNWISFDIHPRSSSCDLQTYGVTPSANKFCLLRGVDQKSHTELIFMQRHFYSAYALQGLSKSCSERI